MGVVLAIAIILTAVTMLAGVPDPLVWGTVFFGVLFVGFWVFIFRVLIGFGRWLIAPADGPPWGTCGPKRGGSPAGWRLDRRPASRTCRDPRCGNENVPGARFCARCGRRLNAAGARETACG